MSSDRLKVFVSYSHDDDPRWLERVQTHLKPLARVGELDLWDDTRIKSGDRWRQEIKDALAQAEVAVLLISANFYASDFIADNELPPLLEAERERGLVILGLHINPSRFDRDEILSEYQTVNPPDQPITSLPEADQEKIFDNLARRIEELAEPTGWSEAFRSLGRGWEGYTERFRPRHQTTSSASRRSTRSRPSS